MQLSTIQLSEIERQVYEFRRSRQKDSKKCLHFLCIFILWMLFVILICSILCLFNLTFMSEEYHLIEVGEDKNRKLHFLSTFFKEVKFAKQQLERIAFYIVCLFFAGITPNIGAIWEYMVFWKTFKKYPKKEWATYNLHYMRVIISINMFDEMQDENGKYVDVPKMRTLHETALSETFYDPNDPYVFKQMMDMARKRIDIANNNNEEEDPFLYNEEEDPFLYTNIDGIEKKDREEGDKLWEVHCKKLTDQLVNRLSMMCPNSFIAEDHGVHVNSKKYIFGVTYEKNREGLNDKIRILLMQKSKLEKLVKLDDEEIENIDSVPEEKKKYVEYQKERRKDLRKMYEIYQEKYEGTREGKEPYALVHHLFLTSIGVPNLVKNKQN